MNIRTTSHIDWEEMKRLVHSMKEDGDRLHLLIAIQSMLGLRVGDALALTWRDLLGGGEVVITEQKTGKQRKLIVNDSLLGLVDKEFNRGFNRDRRELIFLNKHKTKAISISYVNRRLKQVFTKYNVSADHVSSHLFRKTWAMKLLIDADYSEKALFLIMSLFGHSNLGITKRYLRLDEREASMAYNSLVI